MYIVPAQLPQPSFGYVQHGGSHAHLLRILHIIRHLYVCDIIQRVGEYERNGHCWGHLWVLDHCGGHIPVTSLQGHEHFSSQPPQGQERGAPTQRGSPGGEVWWWWRWATSPRRGSGNGNACNLWWSTCLGSKFIDVIRTIFKYDYIVYILWQIQLDFIHQRLMNSWNYPDMIFLWCIIPFYCLWLLLSRIKYFWEKKIIFEFTLTVIFSMSILKCHLIQIRYRVPWHSPQNHIIVHMKFLKSF